MQTEEMGMLNEIGNYQPDSGAYDDGNKAEGSLMLNPSTVKGLENYEPGDTVSLTIKARYNGPSEDGLSELDIITATAGEMASGPKLHRMKGKLQQPE